MIDRVGPILEACEVAEAVVDAIRELNDQVVVKDQGSYWRVSVPQKCRVTKAAIERILGRPFQLPSDLERVMPSFSGHFSVDLEEATWTSGQTS